MNTQIALLALVILLLSFFSSDFSRQHGLTGTVVNQHITAADATCEWKGEDYEACVAVDWGDVSGSYAKAYFTRGQPLSLVPQQYDRTFVYCDHVGQQDGTIGGGVYVYDGHQRVVAVDNNLAASCKKDVIQTSDLFTKSFHFQAWKTTGLSHGSGNRGDGVVTIDLPREPLSCELQGRWKTDNKLFKTLGRPQLYCHNAEGTTYGFVDHSGQYVIDDPSLFRWAGGSEPAFDPSPEKTDDYILHLWSCDHLYYTSMNKRYYVQARVENFDSKTFQLHWDYFDDNTLPAVDFFLDLRCALKPEHAPISKKVVLTPPVIEEPRVAEEPFDVDVEDIELEAPIQHTGFLGKIKYWLSNLFF